MRPRRPAIRGSTPNAASEPQTKGADHKASLPPTWNRWCPRRSCRCRCWHRRGRPRSPGRCGTSRGPWGDCDGKLERVAPGPVACCYEAGPCDCRTARRARISRAVAVGRQRRRGRGATDASSESSMPVGTPKRPSLQFEDRNPQGKPLGPATREPACQDCSYDLMVDPMAIGTVKRPRRRHARRQLPRFDPRLRESIEHRHDQPARPDRSPTATADRSAAVTSPNPR